MGGGGARGGRFGFVEARKTLQVERVEGGHEGHDLVVLVEPHLVRVAPGRHRAAQVRGLVLDQFAYALPRDDGKNDLRSFNASSVGLHVLSLSVTLSEWEVYVVGCIVANTLGSELLRNTA